VYTYLAAEAGNGPMNEWQSHLLQHVTSNMMCRTLAYTFRLSCAILVCMHDYQARSVCSCDLPLPYIGILLPEEKVFSM